MKNSKKLVVSSALLVLAPVSHAQQAGGATGGSPPSPVTTLSPVVVTGMAERTDLPGTRTAVIQRAAGLPAALGVVTSKELETINVGSDISNIFRRIPGVVANSLGQGDTGNGFRMRGFATQGTHGADTAVYVDGVPQNIPSSEAGAGHGPAYLEWLTPQMIERIEVIKGPVSALHGDQN